MQRVGEVHRSQYWCERGANSSSAVRAARRLRPFRRLLERGQRASRRSAGLSGAPLASAGATGLRPCLRSSRGRPSYVPVSLRSRKLGGPGRCLAEVGLRVAFEEAHQHLGDDDAADRAQVPSPAAAALRRRLGEDVVPQRRRAFERRSQLPRDAGRARRRETALRASSGSRSPVARATSCPDGSPSARPRCRFSRGSERSPAIFDGIDDILIARPRVDAHALLWRCRADRSRRSSSSRSTSSGMSFRKPVRWLAGLRSSEIRYLGQRSSTLAASGSCRCRAPCCARSDTPHRRTPPG